ncbi:hypothetical protein EK21DRAFT_95660 [Setomelanomma holmii]|uniref:Uncharacterized protein n=1 Tax=Setomelanomma holmii TaxID=210430 RepID=A0A9P4LFD7_9PLEO|nr:hypothetical protein EK21DRAFT_95660 [Setomelanomma holmii]
MRERSKEYVRFSIQITLRNQKGHRKNAKYAPRMILYEWPEDRALDPVMWFLSLALADGVFDGYQSFEELDTDDVLQGTERHIYKYKEGMANQPIMRSMLLDGKISPTKIWTYTYANNQVKSLG